MPHKDPRVDAYIEKAGGFAQPILKRIRKLFHQASKDIEETIKWGMPTFEYQGIVAAMAAFKQHAGLTFWKAKLMKDAAGLFTTGDGESDMGSIRLTSVKDLPADKVLIAYIHEAIELNELGVKPTKKKAAAKEVTVPDDLQAALKNSKKARETFENFSNSHRKEYVEWISGAKKDETRQRRIEQAIEMLSEGKSKNWKYG